MRRERRIGIGALYGRGSCELGGIDILINNAPGIGLTVDENGWLAGINVDLCDSARQPCGSAFYGKGRQWCHSQYLVDRWPHGNGAGTALCRGKGSASTTMGQAIALAAKHIRVNAIAPGSIEFPGGVWDQRKRSNPELYRDTLRVSLGEIRQTGGGSECGRCPWPAT